MLVVEWIASGLQCLHNFGIASSNYGSLIAALLAAFILFLVRELLIKAKNYSGVFFVASTVEQSSYRPYKGMRIFYTLVLCSDGHDVYGTSEKTGDIDKKRSYEYRGVDKTRGVVTGRVERNYLRSTVMSLHIVEDGANRQTSSFMTIKVRRYRWWRKVEAGTFYSTAANSKGVLLCGRQPFKEHPIGFLRRQSTSVSQS